MPEKSRRVRRRRRNHGLRRRLNWRHGLLLGLGALLASVVLFFLATGVQKGWQSWRRARLINQAEKLLDQGQLQEAEAKGRAVLVLDSRSLAACRILADLTERENRVETLTWRAQIAQLDPRLDNQLNLASAALRFGQLDVARTALNRVSAADREKASYHVVAGWLARAEGNWIEQEGHFAAAVAQEPKNDLYQFNLAVLEISSPDPEKSSKARNQLQRLTKVGQFHTPALRALLDDALRQKKMSEAESLAQQLQMSQEVSFGDDLLCLDLYRKLNPRKFETLLDKIKPVAERNPQDLAELLDWMNKHGLASEGLRWSDKLSPDLTSKAPVAATVAEALAQTKNWSRLKRWTRSSSWGAEDYLRLAYQAYAARANRHSAAEAEFDSLWKAAAHEAEDSPERQLALARLASRWKLSDEAEQLWLEVAKVPAHRREGLDALYEIYRLANDLPNLRLTAQRLHESSPEEIPLAANAARLALLLDHNTAEGRELARQTYEKAPNDPAAAVTYAFALYSAGRTGAGLDILKKLPQDQLRYPHAAVYAALLYDDENQTEIADQYIAIARAGPIFPEEKRLLEDIAAHRQLATPVPGATPGSSQSPGVRSPAAGSSPSA